MLPLDVCFNVSLSLTKLHLMFYRLRNDKDQAGNLNSLSINQETGRVYVSGGIDYESTKVFSSIA